MFELLQSKKLNQVIWQSEKFSVYRDRVVQDGFEAKALSSTEITSNYQSLGSTLVSPLLYFKFSINGQDNEMEYGKNHLIHCVASDGSCQSPLIKFGQQFLDDTPVSEQDFIAPDTRFIIRLDMREVLASFDEKGFYTTYNGDIINKQDFEGVYVVGSAAPLSWDFTNLSNRPDLQLEDPDQDGIYEATIILKGQQDEKADQSWWQLTKDISAYPQYTSEYPLVNALYNMGLEEMVQAVEADNTLRTGKEWAGVWTRDVSYSIILSMATLLPEVSQCSLMKKVKKGRIIQDTGTGGAYPVSTDRMVWAVAAWEIYKVTGDQRWLQESYHIIKNSLEHDFLNAYDWETGLVRGESSFLDWREQTYPEWMQPADIYLSECLGTSAIHYQANVVLSQMANLLQDAETHDKHKQVALNIRNGINKNLWQPGKGYYGQYLYGRNYKVLSPRAEALGEALCVLFDIADSKKQKTIVAQTPVNDFGIPCIYPQIPGIPPYHNKAVWPFVQGYWTLATAKAGNEEALTQSINAIYRPAALFLTNKENFVVSTGDYAGTQINSDNMLWSLAGKLSITYKIFFGLQYSVNSLTFKPFIPKAFSGTHQLINFKYRKAVLDILVEGYGNKIREITLDGQELAEATLLGDLEGKHVVKILLANKKVITSKVNNAPDYISPATPEVICSGSKLSWQKVENASEYKLLKNGQVFLTTHETEQEISTAEYAEYQVIAVDAAGYESFASEPLVVLTEETVSYHKLADIDASDYLEISKHKNTEVPVSITILETGTYALDFWYLNGNGPIETENKCAIRTLRKDSTFLGTVVMPQRGANNWTDGGYSNAVVVHLEKGKHLISLTFEPANENMNGEINQALLAHMRIRKIK